MIKRKEVTKTFVNKKKIANYWAVINQTTPSTLRSRTIIPVSNDNNKFRELIINAIKEASETIMLCSFILSDKEIIEALIAAANRKVRVYLLFSTETQLDKEYKVDKSEFDEEMVEKHKDFLDKIKGKALARSAVFHAKYLLVDYGQPKQIGFISTANFTAEALSRNQELGIIIKSASELDLLFRFFQQGFWNDAKLELHNNWVAAKTFSLKSLPSKKRMVFTSEGTQSLKKMIKKIINSTSEQLIVSSYSFKRENEITRLLIDEAKKRKVIVLTRPRYQNIPTLDRFLENGAEIYCYDYIHAKFLMAPIEKKALIMTANYDNLGLESGYELGVFLHPHEVKELEQIANHWIKNAQYQYLKGKVVAEIIEEEILFFEGTELKRFNLIKEEIFEEQKELNDLRERAKLENIEPSSYPFIKENELRKRITVKRTVIPPKLPPGCKKIKEDEASPFNLYESPLGERYILIKNEKQLEEILKIANKKTYRNIRFVTG